MYQMTLDEFEMLNYFSFVSCLVCLSRVSYDHKNGPYVRNFLAYCFVNYRVDLGEMGELVIYNLLKL